MTKGALIKINSALPDLSPTLKKLAEYVSGHPQVVIYQTVVELVDAAGGSEGSVIRLCQELGFSGFQDFKLALAVDVAATAGESVSGNKADTVDEMINQIVRSTIQSLEASRQLFDPASLEQAADYLVSASDIIIFGFGASAPIAQFFSYKLLRLGLTASSFSDPHLAAMSAANLNEKSVAIAVSGSGSTIDAVHAANVAKEAGARIIVVTNRLKSKLSGFADSLLIAASPESPLTGGAVLSKINQLLVLEVLFTVIVGKIPGSSEHIRRTAAAVVEKSY